MTRNLKALGLAVGVLALSALTASAASAAEFKSEIEPTTLTATAVNTQVFIAPGDGKLECKEISFDKTTMGKKTATEIKAFPTYNNCTVTNEKKETLPAHVEFGNCYYLLTNVLTVSKEHYIAHLKCGAGEEVKVKVTISGVKIKCMSIPEQTPPGGGVFYTNSVPKKDITIDFTLEEIEYSVDNAICGVEGVANNGTYAGQVTMTGENGMGEQRNIGFE